MGYHARLSPSGAETWLACPGSVLLVESLPVRDDSSTYAEEGTCAHDLAALKAQREFGQISEEDYQTQRDRWTVEWYAYTNEPGAIEEFDRHTDAYVDLLREKANLAGEGAMVFIEQRVDPEVPECDGTGDAIIVSPTTVEVVDLKYGQGVRVIAKGNPQLRLYGLGGLAYADLLGDPETVTCTVFQPRLDHVSSETLTVDEIRAWRDNVVIPRAQEALQPGASFGPSAEACRWCAASGRCQAQAADIFATDFNDIPGTMTPEEIGHALGKVEQIKQWLSSLEETALDLGYNQGMRIPGWKPVRSGGTRSVKDPDRAIEVLHAAGYDEDDYMSKPQPKVQGIGVLEKLLGKGTFHELLEVPGIVAKSEGRVSLVPDDDPRQSINRHAEAAAAFGEED